MHARHAAAIGIAALAGTLAYAAPAARADSCSYDAATRTVTALHDEGFGMSLGRDGKAIVASSFSEGALTCGAATVRNTDTIVFRDTSSGGGFNGLNLNSGPFAPGATKEPTGKSEIEIAFSGNRSGLNIVGQPFKRNRMTIGSGGLGDATRGLINLNNDDDADLGYSGMAPGALALYGAAANDQLSAAGGKGTGGPATTGVLLDGGGGNDVLLANNGVGDLVNGEAGSDRATVDCSLDDVSNVESTTCA
jgi:hypothetical protein